MLPASELSTVSTSLTGRPWVLREADERQVAALAQKYDLPEVLARILAARGVTLEAVEGVP